MTSPNSARPLAARRETRQRPRCGALRTLPRGVHSDLHLWEGGYDLGKGAG
jgi:hypothetical protein